MIRLEKISKKEIDIVNELIAGEDCIYVSNTAKFLVRGDVICCYSSMSVNPQMELDLVSKELRILRLKQITEGLGYTFKDLRKQVNN